MKKRVGLTVVSALVVTVFGIVVIGFADYCLDLRRLGKDDLIPIEEITGINSQATLKPGCRVMHGYDFPCDDEGVRCHSVLYLGPLNDDVIEQYLGGGHSEDLSQSVSNIRIVDLYGDKCTITFHIADFDDSDVEHRLGCDEYPLENLDYNVKEVEAANDGIRAKIIGSRYTLNTRYLKRSQRIIIAVTMCGAEVGGISVLLRARKNKHKGDSLDE